ncbi:hypothetical protein FRC02_009731 [Tulasnella sp. 418]|nr:hypothetical protein FRC02_009731 [Tulasnella sp. 418]
MADISVLPPLRLLPNQQDIPSISSYFPMIGNAPTPTPAEPPMPLPELSFRKAARRPRVEALRHIKQFIHTFRVNPWARQSHTNIGGETFQAPSYLEPAIEPPLLCTYRAWMGCQDFSGLCRCQAHLDGTLGVEDTEREGSEPPSFPHFEGEGFGAGATDQVQWLVEPVEMGQDTQEKSFVSDNIRDQVFNYSPYQVYPIIPSTPELMLRSTSNTYCGTPYSSAPSYPSFTSPSYEAVDYNFHTSPVESQTLTRPISHNDGPFALMPVGLPGPSYPMSSEPRLPPAATFEYDQEDQLTTDSYSEPASFDDKEDENMELYLMNEPTVLGATNIGIAQPSSASVKPAIRAHVCQVSL